MNNIRGIIIVQYGSNYSGRAAEQVERSTTGAVNNVFGAGIAWFDLMLGFQRELQKASLQSFSSYSPTAGARISGRVPQANTAGIQVVPVGEERLNVATHTVQGETTRVRRRVVSQPVEQQVTLRDEKVVVERRRPAVPDAKGDVLTETVIEMSDSHQVPTVWKSLHVSEEVVLRKQVTERTEKVREVVRRDVVDVEHDRSAIEGRVADALPGSLKPAEQEYRALGEAAAATTEKVTDRAIDESADKKLTTLQPTGRKG